MSPFIIFTFNRTRIECKLVVLHFEFSVWHAFNRTRIECKLGRGICGRNEGFSPLIELEQNVNGVKVARSGLAAGAFNRTRIECKSRSVA